jgi:hypothetical protein
MLAEALSATPAVGRNGRAENWHPCAACCTPRAARDADRTLPLPLVTEERQ